MTDTTPRVGDVWVGRNGLRRTVDDIRWSDDRLWVRCNYELGDERGVVHLQLHEWQDWCKGAFRVVTGDYEGDV